MDKDRILVGVCGGEDFGKSVGLKRLIYELAQDEKTEKCSVKLAKLLSHEKIDYYNSLVEEEKIGDIDELKKILKKCK